MPQALASAQTAAPPYKSDVLVGSGHLVIDRPLAASAEFPAFTAVVLSGGYWAPSNAHLADSDVWVADTLTALGDIVVPATRTVTKSADATNTGDGTVTVTAAASARAGLFQAVCVAEAGNLGTFRVIDPTGLDLGSVTVGTAATRGGLTITIADGSADWDKGDRLEWLVADLRAYEATAIGGDGKTHGTTEPTWPTGGSTVTDDAVTWTDLGVVTDLRTYADVGILQVAEAVSTASGERPTMPIIQSGQVSLAQCTGIPTTYAAGQWLGHLLLEA